MKPTIDPISGMPYLSHVNDIETIATLRAEIERLTADLKQSSLDQLAALEEVERLTRERDEAVNRENDLANKYTVHPSHCPITGRPFFMAIENESGEMVATYGGPFDSYTIPEWSIKDQEFRSKRYDHDAGHWVEGGEPYSLLRFVDEDEHNKLTAERDQLREQLAAAHTQIEELKNVVQLAAFALAKREPEQLTETRSK